MSPVVSPCLIPQSGTVWTGRQSPALLRGHQDAGDEHSSINSGHIPVSWRGSRGGWDVPDSAASSGSRGRVGMTQEEPPAWGQVGSGE